MAIPPDARKDYRPPLEGLHHLLTNGERVLVLVITDVLEIQALVLPYTENGKQALDDWSRDTETRLNEIKTNGIPQKSADMTEFRDAVAPEGSSYLTPFEEAKKGTILAVKTAAGEKNEQTNL